MFRVRSDYYSAMGYEKPVRFLEQVELTSGQRKLIVGGNAARSSIAEQGRQRPPPASDQFY